MKNLFQALLAISAFLITIKVLVVLIEPKMTFFPHKQLTRTPADFGVPYEEHLITTIDGESLCSWFLGRANPTAYIVFFHGNGGNISVGCLDYLVSLQDQGYSVFAFDYRGYGESTGSPSMEGVYEDTLGAYAFLLTKGVDPGAIVACDTGGTLHAGREDLELRQREFSDKWRICRDSNTDRVVGGIAEALRGADVCIALSAPGPGIIRPEWIKEMAPDPIVFACANPVPEIWPEEAREAGARIVATGRCDLPNQVNNSLAFPGIFRGALDVRARQISDRMAIAAAYELAAFARERGLREDAILPTMEEWQVYPRVAAATASAAQDEGLTETKRTRASLLDEATKKIRAARKHAEVLVSAGIIALPPT